jgi:CheY-like chemotaxis protein
MEADVMTPLDIVYVEDELDIRIVGRVALEGVGGFRVRTCASGAEALEVATAAPPDLMLLDVVMPGLDGPMTMARLQEAPQTQGIPIIFLTAKVQTVHVARYRQLGAIGVIAKPFEPMALASKVRQLWERYRVGIA